MAGGTTGETIVDPEGVDVAEGTLGTLGGRLVVADEVD